MATRSRNSGSSATPKRRSRGRRSAQEAARTRACLLRHAERLFARKGYSATSLRELAKVAGVRMFTIHHHFGSKLRLYEEVRRGGAGGGVGGGVRGRAGSPHDPGAAVARGVGQLFVVVVANRGRLALNARAVLGEGRPGRLPSNGRSWVRFMSSSMEAHELGEPHLDVGLLLITIEGILHNHILGSPHYRHLFGRDVTDPRMAAAAKRHLTQVILALLGRGTERNGAGRRGRVSRSRPRRQPKGLASELNRGRRRGSGARAGL